MTPVVLDVESRSYADLTVIGGRRYWEDPSSEILCVVWYDTATGDVGAWAPSQPWPHAGRTLAAHNAHGFDRFALARYGITAPGWIDTSQLARKAGLPGSLDALGVRWCGVPKDAEGSDFTKGLSRVSRPIKGQPGYVSVAAWAAMPAAERRACGHRPAITQDVLDRVVRYCASDVQIMAQAWPRLQEWLGVDADVEALDRVINDRGVRFDSALARRLIVEDARCAALAVSEVARELGMSADAVRDAALSPKQFCAMTGVPNAQAATVETIDHPLARARMALASIAQGKIAAGLARVHADGRLRDTMRYYGGHTGRWSSTGMQLQNLPRPDKRFEDLPAGTDIPYQEIDGHRVVDVDRYADEVLAGKPCESDAVSMLVRATICASLGHAFAVCDFSSVEARATAWAAGDSQALDVFRSSKDPYKAAAAAIYGVAYDAVTKTQRQVGKVAELACGYGGGPNAFEKFAGLYRVDLSALNLRSTVDAWRALHSPIRDLWYACERAFRAAIKGKSAWAGPFEFVHAQDDNAVACFLPSGRPIVYHEPRDDHGLTYLGRTGEEHIYGGKIVENAIQALCRDLMARAMLRAEAESLNPVLTVHDEIACDVPAEQADAAYQTLHAAMTDLPSWARGFPVDASGWVGKRYRK